MRENNLWVLQICHSYYPPFLDCARQGSQLFHGSPYKVLTVYLTGEANEEVAIQTASDEVVFMGYASSKVSGLKLGAIRKLRNIVASRTFAFCLAHRAKPTYVALLATSLPVISLRHNYGDFKRWSRRLMVNCFQHRLQLLGVSDSVRDEMRAHLPHWPVDRILTLYNHIDVPAVQAQLLSRAQARELLQLPSQAFIISNVGRLHKDKDQATLIQAFCMALPALPEGSLLVIIGSGPLQEQLHRQITTLGLQERVKLTGNVANARQYFRAFDVFALSSDHEPFGMVLLEAMAADLPIICSDTGGGAEVAGKVGQLFPQGNSAQLARCMIDAVSRAAGLDKNAQLAVLNEVYSDQAARQTFWRLPFIAKMNLSKG